MKLYIKRILFLVAIGLSILACDSFTEIDLPETQLTGQAVFKDDVTATAALMDIYARIREGGMLSGNIDGLSHLLGIYTDELDFYGTATSPAEAFYNHTVIPTNAFVSALWDRTYSQIYATNVLLKGLENNTDISKESLNILQGEALFIRGLLHVYLVELFGDVPYISTPDYVNNASTSRTPVSEVYENVVADLLNAKNLLSESYTRFERVRPNKFAVSALLSRIYLYTKNYELAALEASYVIDSDIYQLESNLDYVFLKNASSSLWQLHSGISGVNTIEARTFIFESGPPIVSAVSQNLLDAFELTDMRKNQWLRAITDGTTTWYHPYKYKQNGSTGVSEEYAIILRLEECYLIRSEARTHLDNFLGAQQDLNKIRNRAGLSNTLANTKTLLLEAILQERRVEFFTEHGHRFIDLKRNNSLGTVLSPLKPSWKTTHLLLPLPEKELLLNNSLQPQNMGY
tara:strand:- start:6556 stop:7935 length:1380 start_codon:yes stop_codon:yes gene_type:complete